MDRAEQAIVAQAQEMAHVTVAHYRAEMRSFTCRVLTGTLLSILLCLLVAFPIEAVEKGEAFEQSGIHFPGGFDLNTVGDLSGKATGLFRPASNGPVILNIETAWEKYAVVTCPPWYWDELKIKASVGDEIRVIGSKSLGRDGHLYVIAQEIHFVGQEKTITLRSKTGAPLWSGPHGKTDSQHGSGKQTRGQKQ
jgi:hypothetical protein